MGFVRAGTLDQPNRILPDIHIFTASKPPWVVLSLNAPAVASGVKVVKPLQDQFYGDRTATLEDPFGHVWFVAGHKEDLSPDDINRRAEALFKRSGV